MNPMKTINSILSRIRPKVKAIKKDAFITDRYLFSLVMKFAPALLKREDSKNVLISTPGIYETIPYVELVNANKIETTCFKLPFGPKIKRTKHRLPEMWMGYYGPLLKSVSSISGPATNPQDEGDLQFIDPSEYANIIRLKTSKYNKTKYYWFADGYLWFPNLEWEAVRIVGLFNSDIKSFGCEECKDCSFRQDHSFPFPDYLLPELENFIYQDLGAPLKIPSDGTDDKQNLNRN